MLRPSIMALLLSGGIASTGSALAADPCSEFKWDVTQERTLFAGPAAALAAGKTAPAAPTVTVDRLFELTLVPQADVAFVSPPRKTTPNDGMYAGVFAFKVSAGGSYRVAVDVPLWIDVVEGNELSRAKAFQGVKDCRAPHKIVEYELAPAHAYVLQLSASPKQIVRLTVTQSLPAAPQTTGP